MANSVRSALFQEIRSAWPNRPYPLLVDHLEVLDGRICPAASLYAFGKAYGEILKKVEVEPGEVVACFPTTWIQWTTMLQACLRAGAVFSPLAPNSAMLPSEWRSAVEAGISLDAEGATRQSIGRRLEPNTILVGPPPIALTEREVLEVTRPEIVDPLLSARGTVWLDDGLAPLAEALAVITLLRAGAEAHVGLPSAEALGRAGDDDRWFDGAGASSSVAAVRSWARAAD